MCCLLSAGLVLYLPEATFGEPSQTGKEPVAIVGFVSGAAESRARGGATGKRIELFDLLTEGTELHSNAGAVVRAAFSSGSLFEIAGASRAVIGSDGFKSCQSGCRLVSRATKTDLAPIIKTDDGHRTVAAMRIRDAGGRGLVSLPDPVTLRFEPWTEDGADHKYRLVIMDRTLNEVLSTLLPSAVLTLPSGTLSSGSEYVWSLHGIDGDKVVPIVEEKPLRILGRTEVQLRENLHALFADTKEISWLLLLARWDADAGLGYEACAELGEAVMLASDNAAIRQAFVDLGCTE